MTTPKRILDLLVLCICTLLCCAGMERPEASEAELEEEIRLLRKQARDQLHADVGRIVEVGYRLRVGAAALCEEEIAPLLGAAIARRGDLVLNPWVAARLGGKQDEVEEAVGTVGAVKVLSVVEGSPADQGGVQVGDLLLSLNGDSIKKTTDVYNRLRRSNTDSLALRVQRGDSELDLLLPRQDGCNQGVLAFLSSGADTLPHANRHEIGVPTGLVRFSRDTDEIAIAIAHQIAHQVQGTPHPRRGKDEPEADRLGLHMAARAGFDVSKAPAFWDRLAAEEPWKIHHKPTWEHGIRIWHSAMALRAPVIRSTVAEIAAGADPAQ